MRAEFVARSMALHAFPQCFLCVLSSMQFAFTGWLTEVRGKAHEQSMHHRCSRMIYILPASCWSMIMQCVHDILPRNLGPLSFPAGRLAMADLITRQGVSGWLITKPLTFCLSDTWLHPCHGKIMGPAWTVCVLFGVVVETCLYQEDAKLIFDAIKTAVEPVIGSIRSDEDVSFMMNTYGPVHWQRSCEYGHWI